MSGTQAPGRMPVGIGVLMGVEAASLAVMSFLHLHGDLTDGAPPFRPVEAGIAEAIICVVLLAGAVAVWRIQGRARSVAVAATGFAIAGFLLGITVTIAGGATVDIAYHSTVLPLLVVTMVLLVRGSAGSRSTGQQNVT